MRDIAQSTSAGERFLNRFGWGKSTSRAGMSMYTDAKTWNQCYHAIIHQLSTKSSSVTTYTARFRQHILLNVLFPQEGYAVCGRVCMRINVRIACIRQPKWCLCHVATGLMVDPEIRLI